MHIGYLNLTLIYLYAQECPAWQDVGITIVEMGIQSQLLFKLCTQGYVQSIAVLGVMKHSPPKAYMPLCRKMIQEEGDKFYIFELGVLSGSVYQEFQYILPVFTVIVQRTCSLLRGITQRRASRQLLRTEHSEVKEVQGKQLKIGSKNSVSLEKELDQLNMRGHSSFGTTVRQLHEQYIFLAI